jgi:hypothetical protein
MSEKEYDYFKLYYSCLGIPYRIQHNPNIMFLLGHLNLLKFRDPVGCVLYCDLGVM